MKRLTKYLQAFVITLILIFVLASNAAIKTSFLKNSITFLPPDTTEEDTTKVNLIYPFHDNTGNPYTEPDTSALYLKDPVNIETFFEYDPETNQFIYKKKIGDFYYRDPTYMNFDEFLQYDFDKSVRDYWKERSITAGADQRRGIIPQVHIASKAFDKIFGGSTIDIRPQGSAELTFGILSNRRDDPLLNVRQQKTTSFDFREKIQMNVIAKIGDKIEFRTNYNTESQFDFENKLKLKYEGDEDDIIKLIEAGDVSLPLNTSLITGSQALFGVKTRLQFGRTMITALFSEQESESKTILVEGGAQRNEFRLSALDYEEDRHFFVAQYFRDHYENALKELPLIASEINITKIEVWVTNIGAAVTENRNIIAFTDLGENGPYNPNISPNPGGTLPSNNSNNLLEQLDTSKVRNINVVSNYLKGDPFGIGKSGYMVSGEDFEKIESARKLLPSEYTYNSKLGFITLNTTLNPDQTLAVAYQYQKIGDSAVYRVGELSDEGINSPKCLIVKLLKSTSINTKNPLWDLMMKNVYSLGAYQVNPQDFILNIFYSGNENGVPTAYFTEGSDDVKGVPLLRLMGFDNLDQQSNPYPDGVFDFINGAATRGGTIESSNGRVYFSYLEPFGEHIHEIFGQDTSLASKYAYDSLYTQTKAGAEQFPDKNKYSIEGYYKSSVSDEISLNAFNIPRGSVTVTAGGRALAENVDYTVDYTLGRVRIINEGILNSGTPIRINLENNALFSIQTKRLMGMHIDHRISDKFNIGGTVLNLTERPLTQKTNYGDDPISNTIWGLNLNYETGSRWLTKIVDKIPLIETKAPSLIRVDAEFAHFLPGHSKTIGKSGTSYIDDFEGSKSTIDLKNIGTWFLASTPQKQEDLFPEAAPTEGINYGKNRAKIAWYVIDPSVFYSRSSSLRPPNIDNEELSKNSVRQVLETEVFPNRDIPSGQPTNIPIFNLAYYPSEKGPYNFDAYPEAGLTAGIDKDGNLEEPETRWGGIMRKIESTDFEATNVEYIEFWMMDPFTEDSTNPGDIYINLGDVSEDILRDSRKSYENGLPTSPEVANVDTTIWGRVPTVQALVESFDNDPASRLYQDVGYDGLMDEAERSFFEDNPFDNNYLEYIEELYLNGDITQEARDRYYNDPSSDNYHYYRGTDYDESSKYSSILERYKDYNGSDGNSPTDAQNPESYQIASSTLPNVEDINRDNTLSEGERYFQYRIKLDPDEMEIGKNYITDIHEAKGVLLPNKERTNTKWYQFKIPIQSPDKVVGNIEDFRSIRFMRLFMRGFQRPVVCRFATLELVRGEWRRYQQSLLAPGLYIPQNQQALTKFDISAVNIEENGKRIPINYMEPPGIDREINLGTTELIRMNEQSMVLKVADLIDGDARAAFKTTDFDFRQYKNLKMFVHAEKMYKDEDLDYGDLTVFLRFGSDFTENYYEYEIPLKFTPWYPGRDPEAIWPQSDEFDINLEELVKIKHNRNIKMRGPNSNISTNKPYIEYKGDDKITILGVPSISDVQAIMIGVRNPKKQVLTDDDDGRPKSAEIWVNELRLTDFNTKGGWAATARVSAQLADLGKITVSGAHSTPNFGSLDQKINETQRESVSEFDISTDLQLGMFFPEEAGIKLPMHYDYSEAHVVPEYNPLDPDIKLKDELDSYDSKEKKDSIREITQEFIKRKNINFMNVRKTRVKVNRRPRIYDIENFNFSYAYSEIYVRNIDVEFDTKKTHRGGFGYNFGATPKTVEPFKNVSFIPKTELFQLIRDFNFYYLPKNISFNTEMYREINERRLRNKSRGLVKMETYVMKRWDWTRNYQMKFDLAKSLTFNYNANARAYIDEPQGLPDNDTQEYDEYKDKVWDEVLSFGSLDNYQQSIDLTYNVPINKIPFFKWVSASAGYKGQYSWMASPKSIRDRVGNQIDNSNTKNLQIDLAFSQLFSIIPYIKDLDREGKGGRQRSPMDRLPQRKSDEKKDDEGEETPSDTTEKPKINYFKIIGDNILKIIAGVKRASLNYVETNGTFLPGYLPEPNNFGLTWSYTPDTSHFSDPSRFGGEYPTSLAPGIGFVFGDQRDITNDAFEYGWITPDSLVSQAYATKHTDKLNFKASYEPFPDFRIDISADRAYAHTNQAYLRVDSTGSFQRFSEMDNGSFSMSYMILGTSFDKSGANNISQVFENFKMYRLEIAERLANDNPNWNGTYIPVDTVMNNGQEEVIYYPSGYGPDQQEVMHYAFLAAYAGKEPGKVSLSRFPDIPIPNWRITFTGLTKISFLKNLFRKMSLSHSYTSTYNVASFRRFPEYAESDGHSSRYFEESKNFIPRYDIGVISVTEQFSPLIGLDMTANNNMTSRLEYKKSRNLSFSFINNQLTEIKSEEFVVSLGYKIKDVSFSFISGKGSGTKRRYKSDLDIRADFSLRNNKTIMRRLDEDVNQISAGQEIISINVTLDYMLNQRFNIRLFFDKVINDPFVSNQYRRSTTKGGLTLRFMLNQ